MPKGCEHDGTLMQDECDCKGSYPAPGSIPKLPQSIFNMERPKRRVLRHFVQRGGELVEVEQIVRETR